MEFQDCINYLLTTAQHEVFGIFSGRLAAHGLTPTQYAVLKCLWDSEGSVNPKDIAQSLCLETSTISGVLDRMQKKGLIDRLIDLNDRRCVLVTITEEGRGLEKNVMEAIRAANEEALADFSPEEAETLRICLRRLGSRRGC